MILTDPLYLAFMIMLPVLWWLVRALPPRPHDIDFPPTPLLHHLQPIQHHATHTPLWLLILRGLSISLLILAFARPVILPALHDKAPKKLVLVIDNGWASAPHWAERLQTARNLAEKTFRIGGAVTVFLTARNEDGQWPAPLKTSESSVLQNFLIHLHPQNWPVERYTLARNLSRPDIAPLIEDASVTFLSDGLAGPAPDHMANPAREQQSLLAALKTTRMIDDIRWPECDIRQLHRITSPHDNTSDTDNGVHEALTPRFVVETLPSCPSVPASISGMTLRNTGNNTADNTDSNNDHFHIIAHWDTQTGKVFSASLPDALDLPLNALRLDNTPAPEGMLLLSSAQHYSSIGLLRLSGDDAPLTGSSFYLMQALAGFGHIATETSSESLLKQPLSIIIAPDGSISNDTSKAALLHWVQQGGMLIRFAGNDLAQAHIADDINAEDSLIPVPLLHGMRQLGGPMSWDVPQKMAPFPENSPFFGLVIPSEVTISRQVLAKPFDNLQDHVWAKLADGTPLVTARQEGKGVIILFHITPAANWSNLPLSGLFPQMLGRLVTKASEPPEAKKYSGADNMASGPEANTALPPWRILNKEGLLQLPSATVMPLSRTDSVLPGPFHPAGFYGSTALMRPLDLDTDHQPLHPEPLLGTPGRPDLLQEEHPLAPLLTALSMALLLLDAVMSLHRHHAPFWRKRGLAEHLKSLSGLVILPFFYAALTSPALAQKTDHVPATALETSLAYIRTDNDQTNMVLQQGLDGLSAFVNQRSTAHLGKAVGVIPGQDNLAFYPLLYWAISPRTTLDGEQRMALNDYMRHGGLLVIDEMGANSLLDGRNGAATQAALHRASEGLNIPPLTQLDQAHVLTHSFYLLQQFPGRIAGQPVYVAHSGSEEGDDVSPVIIGNSDWIHAWAVDNNGNTPFAVIPDEEKQRVLAYRMGMNMVMYALTGNYKNDQRLYPEMLRRLDSIRGSNATNGDPGGDLDSGSSVTTEESGP